MILTVKCHKKYLFKSKSRFLLNIFKLSWMVEISKLQNLNAQMIISLIFLGFLVLLDFPMNKFMGWRGINSLSTNTSEKVLIQPTIREMLAWIAPWGEIQRRSEVVGAVRQSIRCDKAVVYPILSNALRNIEKILPQQKNCIICFDCIKHEKCIYLYKPTITSKIKFKIWEYKITQFKALKCFPWLTPCMSCW